MEDVEDLDALENDTCGETSGDPAEGKEANGNEIAEVLANANGEMPRFEALK